MLSEDVFSSKIPDDYKLFLKEWHQEFSLNYLTTAAKTKLKQKLQDPRFKNLKNTILCPLLGISTKSAQRMRQKPSDRSSIRGRKSIIDPKTWARLIELAEKRRENLFAVSIKWTENKFKHKLRKFVHRIPSRWTIGRYFKKHKWKKRKAQRRNPYYLTEPFQNEMSNFQTLLASLLNNFKGTLHIMDESGIFTNMFPYFTYVSSNEKDAYVKASPDTTKDTVIVTLSSNGNGDLMYVPFRRQTKHDAGCSGVGINEMTQWALHFCKNIAKKGDILIMDNLASHHNINIVNILESAGISVYFFPIRAASKLSPLDNCFFAVLKFWLAEVFPNELCHLKGPELRTKKRDIVYNTFASLIEQGFGIRFFYHCGYDKLGLFLPPKESARGNATMHSLPLPFEQAICATLPFKKVKQIKCPPTLIGQVPIYIKIFVGLCLSSGFLQEVILRKDHSFQFIHDLTNIISKAQKQKSVNVSDLKIPATDPRRNKPIYDFSTLLSCFQDMVHNCICATSIEDRNICGPVPYIILYPDNLHVASFWVSKRLLTLPNILIIKLRSCEVCTKARIQKVLPICAHKYRIGAIIAETKKQPGLVLYHSIEKNNNLFFKYINSWSIVHQREPLDMLNNIGYGEARFLIYYIDKAASELAQERRKMQVLQYDNTVINPNNINYGNCVRLPYFLPGFCPQQLENTDDNILYDKYYSTQPIPICMTSQTGTSNTTTSSDAEFSQEQDCISSEAENQTQCDCSQEMKSNNIASISGNIIRKDPIITQQPNKLVPKIKLNILHCKTVRTHPFYIFEPCYTVSGLVNQGLTCHLNCVIQILFGIDKLREALNNMTRFEIKAVGQLALIFTDLTVGGIHISIGTSELLKYLPNKNEWLGMRDFVDSWYDMIGILESEATLNGSIDFKNTFYQNVSFTANSKLPISIPVLERRQSLFDKLKDVLPMASTEESTPKCTLGKIFTIDLSRTQKGLLFADVDFPMHLDLGKFSLSNNCKQYELFAVVAFCPNPSHLVVFIKSSIPEKWILFDDSYAFFVEEDLITSLRGEPYVHELWEYTSTRKLISKVLCYKAIDCPCSYPTRLVPNRDSDIRQRKKHPAPLYLGSIFKKV